MEGALFEVLYYRTAAGRCPVREWLARLDPAVESVVRARIGRLRRGVFGDVKSLGGGLWELKVDVGPGYRLYYGFLGRAVVLLLYAGDKSRQEADIERARSLWATVKP